MLYEVITERSRRHAVVREDLLGASLVQRERKCQRIAAGVRNVEELADRGHVGLAIHAAQPLRHVEDDIGIV